MSRNKDNAMSTNYAREITKWQYNTHTRKIIVFCFYHSRTIFVPSSYHVRSGEVEKSKDNGQQSTVNSQQTLDLKNNLYLLRQSLPPWRNSVKKLKTQSRRDSETQRNFKTLRLCDFAS